jgi:hypothetical protein
VIVARNAVIVRIATPDDAEQLIALVHANDGEPNLTSEPGEFNMTIEEERAFLASFEHQATSEFLLQNSMGRLLVRWECAVTQGAQRSTL